VPTFVASLVFGLWGYQTYIKPNERDEVPMRFLGYVLIGPWMLVLLAAIKHGPTTYLWPPDRAVRVHRWLGWACLLLSLVHGLPLTLGLLKDSQSIVSTLERSTGTIGIPLMIVLGLASLDRVRRARYGIFRMVHWLWLPLIIIMYLHTTSLLLASIPFIILLLWSFGVQIVRAIPKSRITAAACVGLHDQYCTLSL
jgi:predicted ferric reductase